MDVDEPRLGPGAWTQEPVEQPLESVGLFDDDGRVLLKFGTIEFAREQLRGASKVEEVERSSEVERKSTVVKTRHNFYKQTKVTSHAQEEQSALPAGVLNTYEDTTDEEDDSSDSSGSSTKKTNKKSRDPSQADIRAGTARWQ